MEKFAQVVEGDEEDINALLETLRKDARHTNINVVLNKPIPEKEFGTWSMHFITPGPLNSFYKDKMNVELKIASNKLYRRFNTIIN